MISSAAGKKFEAGDLGPSTIVGSAAFNLFVISAVCIMGIPTGETRRIKDIKVGVVNTVMQLQAVTIIRTTKFFIIFLKRDVEVMFSLFQW